MRNSFKRFYLKRLIDETGVSGTGRVAEGVQFTDGKACLHWLTYFSSIGLYDSMVELLEIHGHGGCTIIEWVD